MYAVWHLLVRGAAGREGHMGVCMHTSDVHGVRYMLVLERQHCIMQLRSCRCCTALSSWFSVSCSAVPAGACVVTPCTNTTCRIGRCTGNEVCSYTSINQDQPCTLPLSRRSARRASPTSTPPLYPTTCQDGMCTSEGLHLAACGNLLAATS
jgi:hypothetical protein